MAYIIAEPCIGTKDTACVDVCPVDCIHPAKGRTYDMAARRTMRCLNCISTPPSALIAVPVCRSVR